MAKSSMVKNTLLVFSLLFGISKLCLLPLPLYSIKVTLYQFTGGGSLNSCCHFVFFRFPL